MNRILTALIARDCLQERAAQLPEAATQQTRQTDSCATVAAAEVVGCLPPRSPCPAVSATTAQLSPTQQQQAGLQSGGASPLPRYGHS